MKTKIYQSHALVSGSRSLLRHALEAAAVVLSLQLVSPRIHGQDNFAPAMNGPVYGMVPEPGGTVMLAGAFYNSPGNSLARYDSAGNNAPFLTRIITGPAQAVAPLPDGTVLACGQMSALFDDGQPILNSFMRFSATGSLLPTFQILYYVPVYCLAPQADGKVLIGGSFTALDGVPRTMLARYLPTGALDSTFAPAANDLVFTIAVQPDGQILAGGMFTSLGGQPRNRLGRLSSTGALDPSFNPNANGAVVCLLVQPDGKILVGGGFTTLGGQSRIGLGRLNPDGSLDTSFNLSANGSVQTLALQANGKILVGGEFTAIGGQARSRLARLNSDGTLDASFTAGANNAVYSLALQEDGKVLVGGDFTVLGGQSRTRAGRLANPDAPTQNVTFDGATLTWQRGGSLTEVWRTEAEAWTGASWTNIGPGTRITGGWQWTGLSLSPDANLRLRGHAKGGRFCSSTWLAQQASGPPILVTQPGSVTNLAGTSAGFQAGVIGGEPITYRWRRNGVLLNDGANIAGANTSSLVLAAVFGADAGAYSLLASNALGMVTSHVATLTVIDPVITAPPASQAIWPGSNATLSVTAVGTAPLVYQWRKDGSALTGATNASYSITNFQTSHAGSYAVVVANTFSSVTSSPAALVVLEPPRITTQPQNQSGVLGGSVTFTVGAEGAAPLSYLWLKDGAAIAGATASAYTRSALTVADIGTYQVVVTNLAGAVQSTQATLSILSPYILTSPASQLVNAGDPTSLTVSAGGAQPLSYQWRKDSAPIAGATASGLTLPNTQVVDAGNYDVLLTNTFGRATSAVAALTVNGAVPDGFSALADAPVLALVPLPEGKTLVGGSFTSLMGVYGVFRLGRLNAQGVLDTEFNTSANAPVHCLAAQADGSLLVGGEFTTLAGQSRLRIGRLSANGVADGSFNPGANSYVYCLAVQPDGRILVGGDFTAIAGQGRGYLARLESDGTLDAGFVAHANGVVHALALQSDGAILVGGSFTTLGGETRNKLARLSASGVVDSDFNPGATGTVYALAAQPDGGVVVGGAFSQLGGASRTNLGRVTAAGLVDTGFVVNTDGSVYTLALQADGGIVFGGSFGTVNGQARGRLARVNAAGMLDDWFLAAANGTVRSLALEATGNLLVAGDFTALAGKTRTRSARLLNPVAPQHTVTFDGATLTWLRGGSSPEVASTSADAWTGSGWTNVGPGTRIVGGWQWSGLALAPDVTLQLHGLAYGGKFNGSSWLSTTPAGRPLLTSDPASRTNLAGSTASFTVGVIGGEPLAYQWLKDGALLGNGGSVTGALSGTLSLTPVWGADSGQYSVIVSNASGVVTSAVAVLTVLDPVITSQPASQTKEAGTAATFSVSAIGSGTLSYQWRKDGVPVTSGTGAILYLPSVTTILAGGYDVVVSSSYGAVTSTVATLIVNQVSASGSVLTFVPAADAKLMVGGNFISLGGQARRNLGRLAASGAVEASFDAGVSPSGIIGAVMCQRDGRLLISGNFFTVAGLSRRWLARLDAAGVVDPGFLADATGGVNAFAEAPDGKIVLGGGFGAIAGQSRASLARLNLDGSLDTTFNPGAPGGVNTLGVQPDGKLVVGGAFSTLAGLTRAYLGQLLPDGTGDTNFNPILNGAVNALLVQADGKIVIAGEFSTVNGEARSRLARLNPDGTLDTGFIADADGSVLALALQADGAIVAGGSFTTLAGSSCARFGRVTSAGVLDTNYYAGADATVYTVALQGDGSLLAGGDFTSVAGQSFGRLAQLGALTPGTQMLTCDGSTATWLRSGGTPELTRAYFEVWNGTGWVPLGAGMRISGGWQLTNLSVSATATFRAWGYVNAGQRSGSLYPVETLSGPPVILAPPVATTQSAGGTAGFQVSAIGGGNLGYRWLKNGAPLADGGNALGTGTASLWLSAVTCADVGAYSVVVTNNSGNVTSQLAWLTVKDPIVAVQPRSVAVALGSDVTLTAAAAGTGPFTYQWRRDGTNLAGATTTALTIQNLQLADACGYDAIIAGACGSATSIVAHLNQELATANYGVLGLVPLPDGRIMVGGGFNTFGGYSRLGFGRLNPNGSVDLSYNPAANGLVYCFVPQPDGGQVIGGYFTGISGWSRNHIARLRPDGSVDPSYNPDANADIVCMALQPDGKVVVGGNFTTLGGTNRSRLARLNADGTVDLAFNPNANNWVYTLALQPDGKILAGGKFTTMGGTARGYLARLLPDGTLDTNFTAQANERVNSIALQADGKILVGGDFSTMGQVSRLQIARLHSSGAVDMSFNPGASGFGYPDWVNSLALQTDGKILVFGGWTTLGGQTRNRLGRLNPDGSVDASFNPGANALIYSHALQADGRLLVGSEFTAIGGTAQVRLARLDNTDLATSSLAVDAGSVTWLRGGTGPEVWRTAFDSWSGVGWTNLGAGTRISGGWQLDGLLLAANATVRAQGFAISGDDNCSSYLVEEGFGPPVVSIAPVNRTNFVGTTASLSAWVVGSGPVSYRWRKGGMALADGGSLSGTGTPNLSLANVQSGDSGWYSVVATNALGSVTSADVYLAVVPLNLSASGPGLGWTTNRQFAFQLNSGGAAWPVSVEASTNLLNWQGLSSFWLGPESAVITDTGATNSRIRLYRAQPVP